MTINLPIGRLYTYDNLTMPIEVVNGRRGGPRLFVSAAIHGDELNGVEIIRRLLRHSALQRLRGTLIAVPVVNVHGLLHRSRYLPDRRDLNRSFPGSSRGSLAGRIADLFMREIVANCTHGIDLHTGAVHRENLPHIRANLDDPATLELARAFGVPVLLNSDLRDGSLREAAMEAGIPMLLYEGGEALRFHEVSIRSGLRGVLHVMRVLGMLPASRRHGHVVKPVVARSSSWVRAPESGVLRLQATLGTRVRKGDVYGRHCRTAHRQGLRGAGAVQRHTDRAYPPAAGARGRGSCSTWRVSAATRPSPDRSRRCRKCWCRRCPRTR